MMIARIMQIEHDNETMQMTLGNANHNAWIMRMTRQIQKI